jgi:hypothetical protein
VCRGHPNEEDYVDCARLIRLRAGHTFRDDRDIGAGPLSDLVGRFSRLALAHTDDCDVMQLSFDQRVEFFLDGIFRQVVGNARSINTQALANASPKGLLRPREHIRRAEDEVGGSESEVCGRFRFGEFAFMELSRVQ